MGGDVAVAGGGGERLRGGDHGAVALRAGEDDGARRAAGAQHAELLRDRGLERPPVEQPGQRVLVGHRLKLLGVAPQLGFGGLAVGHVLDLRHEVPRPATGVAHDRGREQAPHDAAARQHVPLGQLVAVALAGEGLRQQLGFGREVVRMRDRLRRRREQRLPVAFEQRAQRRVDRQEPATRRDERDARRRGLEGAGEPRVRFRELRRRAVALGHVAHDRHEAVDGAALVAQRRQRDRDVDQRAVLAPLARLDRDGLAREEPALMLLDVVEMAFRPQAADVRADHLLGRVAVQALGGGIPRLDDAVQVARQDRVAGGADDRLEAPQLRFGRLGAGRCRAGRRSPTGGRPPR